jgi:TRAP-type uncharacterized transport system fused permease subunit
VFAAAGLAKADMWQSGWQAVRIGAAGFIVPFMFVYEPALLMIGPWSQVLPAIASASIGCVLLAAGLFGYLLRECSAWQRLALVAAALLLIKPGWITDSFGLVLALTVLASQWRGRTRDAAPAGGR